MSVAEKGCDAWRVLLERVLPWLCFAFFVEIVLTIDLLWKWHDRYKDRRLKRNVSVGMVAHGEGIFKIADAVEGGCWINVAYFLRKLRNVHECYAFGAFHTAVFLFVYAGSFSEDSSMLEVNIRNCGVGGVQVHFERCCPSFPAQGLVRFGGDRPDQNKKENYKHGDADEKRGRSTGFWLPLPFREATCLGVLGFLGKHHPFLKHSPFVRRENEHAGRVWNWAAIFDINRFHRVLVAFFEDIETG